MNVETGVSGNLNVLRLKRGNNERGMRTPPELADLAVELVPGASSPAPQRWMDRCSTREARAACMRMCTCDL